MNTNTKRWLISTGITFLTGFILAILPQIDTITLETIQNGAVLGVVFAALRAGVKAVFEYFVSTQIK